MTDIPTRLGKLRRDMDQLIMMIHEQSRVDPKWTAELEVRLTEMEAEYKSLKSSLEGLGNVRVLTLPAWER